MSQLYSNSIFWVDVDKIKPNPFQPRREFEEARLKDLADSIRQYGILQPLTVSRVEVVKEDGGIAVEYELIAGERRLRASKLAGVAQVPVVIRIGDDNMAKLELAIIENLQREDLNAVERARAFFRLVEEFKFTHGQVGTKVGKSREYVSNTLRLLSLPQEVLDALSARRITEGHTRPIMMLADKPEEQMVLFKEIIFKKMNVRDAEKYARRIAVDRVRNKEYILDPELLEMEVHLAEALGTRVHVEKSQNGGQITIDFFTNEDLRNILEVMKGVESKGKSPTEMLDRHIESVGGIETLIPSVNNPAVLAVSDIEAEQIEMLDDRDEKEKQVVEEELYNIKNFSL
ncbi:MAG: ParB/RepB/Spo0J family partition protein [Candidatus Nomurabacteria bacterium]|nr:ParB/RepB/Spo0J family partition protein [Candidatus Nomurabacteria bacterium]